MAPDILCIILFYPLILLVSFIYLKQNTNSGISEKRAFFGLILHVANAVLVLYNYNFFFGISIIDKINKLDYSPAVL